MPCLAALQFGISEIGDYRTVTSNVGILIHNHLRSRYYIPTAMKDTHLYKVSIQYPAEDTIIYAHPPDICRPARRYTEGMKPLNNRRLTLYYEAFIRLPDTYTNGRRDV